MQDKSVEKALRPTCGITARMMIDSILVSSKDTSDILYCLGKLEIYNIPDTGKLEMYCSKYRDEHGWSHSSHSSVYFFKPNKEWERTFYERFGSELPKVNAGSIIRRIHAYPTVLDCEKLVVDFVFNDSIVCSDSLAPGLKKVRKVSINTDEG